MSFVFIAILKSISPVKPPAISLFLSNLFIFETSIPFNKMLLGVVSEIVFQLVPLKVFHVVLLSNDNKEEDQIESEQRLELDNEELTIIKMTGYFMEEDELANLDWKNKTIQNI